jgi:hypothetical protein
MKTLLQLAIMFCGLSATIDFAFAQTWTQTSAPMTNWTTIVSSADGTKLVAACPGVCFISTNSGLTWMATNLPADIHFYNNVPNFAVLAVSADGTKLAGASRNNGIIGVSTNGGLNWSYPTNYAEAAWFSIASSADGKTLALTEGGPTVRASTNSGATWYVLAQLPNHGSDGQIAALSANGHSLVVGVDGSGIYGTTNFGKSWTTNNLLETWEGIAMSADGTKCAAAPYGGSGNIYTSADSGATWLQQTNSPDLLWSSVASSADGTELAAVSGSASIGGAGQIYTSTDSGVTWVSNNVPTQPWEAICSSADGNKLAAVVFGTDPYVGGGIWTLQTTPTTQLNISSSTNNLALSWLIPSTSFVLQQSPDLISWSSVTDTPALNLTNLNYELTLSPSNSSGFFRLISQ